MFDAIATVLAWFYSLIPNYAVAIALLTLTVMLLLTPLTLKGTKSMLRMQQLQPELKRIQNQYKGDRQKMNEELMKLYQTHGINPLGGCLPLLLQAPVFIVLYRVVVKLTETCTSGRVESGKCTADQLGNFIPSYIDKSSDLFKDLSASSQMLSFGIDLSRSASKAISDSFAEGVPYLVMILLVTATSYYQQRQIAARNKGQVVNPQQAMLMKILPAFFALISLTLPAGVVVYFLVSNLYRIAQQGYITHAFYKSPGAASGGEGSTGTSGEGAEPRKPKPSPKPTGNTRPTPSPRPRPSAGPSARPAARPANRPAPSKTGRTTPRKKK